MKKARSFEPHIRGKAHQALIDREAQLGAEGGYRAVYADRLARWARHPLLAKVDPLLAQWALAMTERFGAPDVRIWHGRTDWLTALAIARYGEAEDFWPATFSDGDKTRAAMWHLGAWVPEGVKFAATGVGLARPRLTARPT